MKYNRRQSGLWLPDYRLQFPGARGFVRPRYNFLPGHFPGGAVARVVDDFHANAVRFDGTNDWLEKTTDLTGLSGGQTGLISVWININAYPENTQFTSGAGFIFAFDIGPHEADGGLELALFKNAGDSEADEYISLGGWSSSGDLVLGLTSSLNTYDETSGWLHILASWDVSISAVQLYISDAEDANNVNVEDDTIEYLTGHVSVGNFNQGDNLYDGDMAELWFDTQYLDLSVEANRRLFIDGSGKPVNLGEDGTNPGLGQPLVFLSGQTANWHTNKGTGGGFTEQGELTTAPTSPSD